MKRIVYVFIIAILLISCGGSASPAKELSVPAVEGAFDHSPKNPIAGNALFSPDPLPDKAPVPDMTFADPFGDITSETEATAMIETTAVPETVAETSAVETTTVTEPESEPEPEQEPEQEPEPEPEPEPEYVPVNYVPGDNYFGYPLPEFDPSVIPQPVIDGTVDPSRPMLALTFDDGPSPHTERLLDIFAESGGKGTFFVVGSSIAGRESTLVRMAAEGHEIGNHTWNHANLTTLSEGTLVDELMMTREMIYAVTGVDARIMRPPYGSHNEWVRSVGGRFGFAFINWSVDTLDWKTKNADAVYSEVVYGAYNGAIILCHDLHKTTVDAMETAIPQLIADGYQLVTVSELMYYSGYWLEPGNMYYRQ